ncbi:hypothetical protein RJ640_012470 [Escallonia rubra]|uniref:Late embryogenesis abundant protein n=1 Tax=Escallonia rubra TaxID=112253 RepID=A0AA88U9C6_9ASTE|nr:hypothetical protein RJ640_012470 [Escallonia rubra]
MSGSVTVVARSGMTLKNDGKEATKNTPWVPDPVTGYYRPENQAKELDPPSYLRNVVGAFRQRNANR